MIAAMASIERIVENPTSGFINCQKSSKLFCSFATMTTYYFRDPEEALKKAKAAGKRPGCWYGGKTLRSGKRGWAIYHGGKVVEQYAVMDK